MNDDDDDVYLPIRERELVAAAVESATAASRNLTFLADEHPESWQLWHEVTTGLQSLHRGL